MGIASNLLMRKNLQKKSAHATLNANDEKILWAKSAGRCQYDGCNRILYEDEKTHHIFNFAEKAHIVANSKDGPRGDNILSDKLKRDPKNFMLLCDFCHKRIDEFIAEHGIDRLIEMKQLHENRIRISTSISQSKKTNIVVFFAPIASAPIKISFEEVAPAVLENGYYPTSTDRYIDLSLKTQREDNDDEYWKQSNYELKKNFESKIKNYTSADDINHFSIFGLAPIPLLIKFGFLMGEAIPCEVYQPHRTEEKWTWKDDSNDLAFKISESTTNVSATEIAISLSISGSIPSEDIKKVIGNNIDIWELSCRSPKYDNIQSKNHLEEFKAVARELIPQILSKYKNIEKIKIFPTIPPSVAIEFGRILPQKYSPQIELYDRNNKRAGFFKTITISSNE